MEKFEELKALVAGLEEDVTNLMKKEIRRQVHV